MQNFVLNEAKNVGAVVLRRGFSTKCRTKFAACSRLMTCRTTLIDNPAQTFPDGNDKLIYQAVKFFTAEEKNFLVRVFVNISKTPNLVITVYRTSKIEKYWSDED